MTEADLLALANDGTETTIQLVSTAFAIVSAYIAGLFFFLGRAPFLLRFVSFCLLSITLAFFGLLAFGLFGVLEGADAAWRALPETATGVTSLGGERPPALRGFSIYEVTVLLGFSAFALVYVAMAYMTFIYRWRAPRGGSMET